MNEQKEVLIFSPTIYFDMEPGETREEAEERILNILENEGLKVTTVTSCIRRLEKENG